MIVYADNAATTKIDKQVLDAMMPFLTTAYGNPGSIHQKGREAFLAVDSARSKVASAINANFFFYRTSRCSPFFESFGKRGL